MNLTREKLKQCIPLATWANIDKFIEPLNETLTRYEINTPRRVAAFLAQLAHESGCFRYVKELASGEAYEGRKDLGNIQPGDGVKFKGRGLIQITGRANYQALSAALQYDFITYPHHLEKPGPAAFSAGWFWSTKGLNKWADEENFLRITKIINGGTNGMEDRLKHWESCKKVLY